MTQAPGMWAEYEPKLIALGTRLLVAVLILLAGYLLSGVLAKMASRALKRTPRGQTVASLTRSIVRGVVLVAALTMALDHVGVPVATVLAGAGILGLAVGFGAQALVRDVITGFFHIVEGVIQVGDVAQFGDVTGVVEDIGLRTTQIRTFNGQLWYVPNGSIDRVGNFNRGWCRAVVEVPVAWESDARKVMAVLEEVGRAFRAERPDEVLEEPVADGVLGLQASGVLVRLVLKVKPQTHWGIERELRLRIREALEKQGVELPLPRQVVFHRDRDRELGRDDGRHLPTGQADGRPQT